MAVETVASMDAVSAARSRRKDSFRLRAPSPAAAVFLVIVIGAFLLRVWDVGARAMHLDESTVAWFGWQLETGHGYAYDPVYHGPFQHEVLALLFLLFNSSQTTARLLAVVLGAALVALPWFLRDYLGRAVALWASFLLAISPTFVYFARFERDDTYMEFFTFLLVVFALRFRRDRKPWQLYGSVIAFALAFATKESIYIVAFVFVSYALIRLAGRSLAGGLSIRGRGLGRPSIPVQPLTRRLAALSVFGLLAGSAILSAALGVYLPFTAVVTAVAAGGVFLAGQGPRHSSSVGAARGTGWLFARDWRPHWINAASIALGILVLMYSTFGANLNGLWDQSHPLFNNGSCQYALAFNLDACRRDVAGGLFYWLSQHKVARGNQPWFYYLLIYGLYEQLALGLAAIATVATFVSSRMTASYRSARMFVVYWAVLSVLIYSWAGEKFPWLGIHPLLPITLLAAVGGHDLLAAARRRKGSPSTGRLRANSLLARGAMVIVALLLLVEAHNTLTLNFVDGANPVEMMVYVQSAPDTAADANFISVLSHRVTGGDTLPVDIDSQDTWPFAWYLRNMTSTGYPAGASAAASGDPVIILDRGDAQSVPLPASLRRGYERTPRRLDWWFPEDYKQWSWTDTLGRAVSPDSWKALWDWEIFRTPFGPRDGTWYYLYLKKGYFPPF